MTRTIAILPVEFVVRARGAERTCSGATRRITSLRPMARIAWPPKISPSKAHQTLSAPFFLPPMYGLPADSRGEGDMTMTLFFGSRHGSRRRSFRPRSRYARPEVRRAVRSFLEETDATLKMPSNHKTASRCAKNRLAYGQGLPK